MFYVWRWCAGERFVKVKERDAQGWCTGCKDDGRVGLYPDSYVELLPNWPILWTDCLASRSRFWKSKMAAAAILENRKILKFNISVMAWPIFMKFGAMMQNGSLNHPVRLKMWILKIQDGCGQELTNRKNAMYLSNRGADVVKNCCGDGDWVSVFCSVQMWWQ